jgi:hypothetical protein
VTVSDEGRTVFTARSVDSNGNIEESESDLIKIDKTPPTFALACPAGTTLLNEDAAATISNATDDRSGFADNPNGLYPLSTATAGTNHHVAEIQDKAGNTAQHSCDFVVAYPVPGTPALDSGTTPNASGVFGLAWTASADPADYPSLRYTLQHRDTDDADWSAVDENVASASFAFTGASSEPEGTWRYRASAHDGDEVTGFSDASDAVVVDKTAPGTPTLTPDRAPDYAGDGGWYADTVTVTAADTGDPSLADGSDGSGVDPASVPAPATHAASGSHTDNATVRDNADNESAPASSIVKVDATDPELTVTCPAQVLLHGSASAVATASDAHSGLANDPSGTFAIDTGSVGPKTTTRIVADNTGHSAIRSCTTQVAYAYGGLLQPVDNDGSSVFKAGSTIPVKTTFDDFRGDLQDGVVAHLTLAKVSGNVVGPEQQAVSTSGATTGDLFRRTGNHYMFNLSTKGLSPGTWRLKVTLDDGTEHTTLISLR